MSLGFTGCQSSNVISGQPYFSYTVPSNNLYTRLTGVVVLGGARWYEPTSSAEKTAYLNSFFENGLNTIFSSLENAQGALTTSEFSVENPRATTSGIGCQFIGTFRGQISATDQSNTRIWQFGVVSSTYTTFFALVTPGHDDVFEWLDLEIALSSTFVFNEVGGYLHVPSNTFKYHDIGDLVPSAEDVYTSINNYKAYIPDIISFTDSGRLEKGEELGRHFNSQSVLYTPYFNYPMGSGEYFRGFESETVGNNNFQPYSTASGQKFTSSYSGRNIANVKMRPELFAKGYYSIPFVSYQDLVTKWGLESGEAF